jgi:hypothetical protein
MCDVILCDERVSVCLDTSTPFKVPAIINISNLVMLMTTVTARKASGLVKSGKVYVEGVRVANLNAEIVVSHPTQVCIEDNCFTVERNS